MHTRFDYIAYDHTSTMNQAKLKEKTRELEELCEILLPNGRAKSLVMTKLEEAYMWMGKGLRDAQLERMPLAPEQPERSNS